MSVHVGEIHSEVLPANPPRGNPSGSAPAAGHLADEDERWGAARQRSEQLSRRRRADGYED